MTAWKAAYTFTRVHAKACYSLCGTKCQRRDLTGRTNTLSMLRRGFLPRRKASAFHPRRLQGEGDEKPVPARKYPGAGRNLPKYPARAVLLHEKGLQTNLNKSRAVAGQCSSSFKQYCVLLTRDSSKDAVASRVSHREREAVNYDGRAAGSGIARPPGWRGECQRARCGTARLRACPLPLLSITEFLTGAGPAWSRPTCETRTVQLPQCSTRVLCSPQQLAWGNETLQRLCNA